MNIFRIRTRRALRFFILFIFVCILLYALLSSKPASNNEEHNLPRLDEGDSRLKFHAAGDQNGLRKEDIGRHFEDVSTGVVLSFFTSSQVSQP